MTNRYRPTRRTGVTLIETIVAIVILAVAAPSILWAIRDATVQRVAPIQASKARWLVTEKLEDIIADRHCASRGYSYITTGNYPAESSISGFDGFARTTTVIETGADLATSGAGYKRVTVTVRWSDVNGQPRQIDVSTVLTDY